LPLRTLSTTGESTMTDQTQTRASYAQARKEMQQAGADIEARQRYRDEVAGLATAARMALAAVEREAENPFTADLDFSSASEQAMTLAVRRRTLRDHAELMDEALAVAERSLANAKLDGLQAEITVAKAAHYHVAVHRSEAMRKLLESVCPTIDAILPLFLHLNSRMAPGQSPISRASATDMVLQRISLELSRIGAGRGEFSRATLAGEIDGVPLARQTLRALDADRAAAHQLDPALAQGGAANREALAAELIRLAGERADVAQAADADLYR
jgi:hypothetical protein